MTFDEGYLLPARVLIRTILNQNRHLVNFLEFNLLLVDAPPYLRSGFDDFVSQGANLNFFDFDGANLSFAVSAREDMKRLGPVGAARIFLDKFLDSNCKRVLYLDCDIVCMGSIDDILSMELSGATVGAVQDARARVFSDYDGLPGLSEYPGIDPMAPYFNSGVLVIDVDRWRALDIEGKCLDYLHRNRKKLRYCDQDALNVSLFGDWKPLDSQWNRMAYWDIPKDRMHDARFIHFIDSLKPWLEGFEFEHFREFYQNEVPTFAGSQ
jgi:lipopolysaccharide biosynthesis glycosyltransferase